MIVQQLDKALRNNTLDFLGVSRDVGGFQISVAKLACILLILEREDALTAKANYPVKRYTSETLLDELLDTGLKVDQEYAKILSKIEAEKFVSVDEHDQYYSKKMSNMLTYIFDLVYPTMKGLLLIAYFNQTIEEVASDRKTLQEAVAQVDKTLKDHGVRVDLKGLFVGYEFEINKLVTENPPVTHEQKEAFTSIFYTRAVQRNKTLQHIDIQMKELGGLPALPLNYKILKKNITTSYSALSDLTHVILDDVGMTINFLKNVNDRKSHKAINTVSHGVIFLGHERVKGIVNGFTSMEDLPEGDQKRELKYAYLSSYMGKVITKHFAQKYKSQDIEEIVICSMIHSMGQLIVLYYHPEAYFKIKKLMEQKKYSKRKASRKILGTTYDNIGIHFARKWQFPFLTIESLRVCYFNYLGKSKENVMINLPFCSSELCAFSGGVLDDLHKVRLRELINCLNMFSRDIFQLLSKSWNDVVDFSEKHQIPLNKKIIGKISATG